MSTTRQIAMDEWGRYFDGFTRQHLRGEAPGIATIQAVSGNLGDQVVASNARLLGITFDPHDKTLDISLEGANHVVFQPAEIWVLEGDHDDVLATFEVVQRDGSKEILQVQGGGPVTRYGPTSSEG